MATPHGAPTASHDGMAGATDQQGIRKAVFPAAGLGTRMLPATKAQPKEMLTVVDRPVIQYGIEEAVASGLDQVIVVTAASKGAMEDHFDTSPELERLLEQKGDVETLAEMRRIAHLAQVCYVRQTQALGLGHAVLVAKKLVGDEPFAVFLPDDIIDAGDDPCIGQLLRIFQRYKGPVLAVERVPRQDVPKYGVLAVREIEPRLYQVQDLVEKPNVEDAPSDLAIMGRYVLTPDIFELLERTPAGAGGEIQLTDGLRLLLERRPIYAYEYTGRRYDCGSKLGYLRATVELALRRPELGQDVRRILREALDDGPLGDGRPTDTRRPAVAPATVPSTG
ncbi:MAG: UTP--glucose-1-phosphate uridylyltransferase GalU [Chloroflexota bacterium]